MSHLHLPDGLLPVALWGAGLLVALALIARASHVTRAQSPQRIAYQGALGGLMLAAMAIPLGPFEFHVTLAGPVGVLLGAAGAFQVAFVVSVILALMGHGGLTVVGLNTLVLGAGAAVAAPVYRSLASRFSPAGSLAVAAAMSQVASGAMWLLVVALGMRLGAGVGGAADSGAGGAADGRLGLFAAVSFPLWLAGLVVETLIAFGLGRFLARVQPGLLPHAARSAAAAPGRPAGRTA